MAISSKFKTNPKIREVNRVLLSNISWQTYETLLAELVRQPGTKLTYDRKLLEIMTPLVPHESSKKLIGRLIEAMTEELGIEISCGLWN